MPAELDDPLKQAAASLLQPYPGPRPFKIDEAPLFFGRGREVAQVRSLMLGHTVVLLYAESGAGKTSLLNAGVIPELRGQGVTVFPPTRFRPNPKAPPLSSVANRFVASLAANWALDSAPGRTGSLSKLSTLSDFVAVLAEVHGATPEEPRVLIVDQFEELFTQFPESWEQRSGFFEQLQNAVEAHPDLRVLLALREDFIAQIDPYSAKLANRLQHRFRIERLRRAPALDAVVRPLDETGRRFAPRAAEYLVDQLLQMRLEHDGTFDPIEVPGEFVEPVQLQIVCSSLWDRLEVLELRDEITQEDIDRYAQPDRALARFYGDVVARAAEATGVDEFDIRQWCGAMLITSGGTRALVYRGTDDTEGIPNEVIDRLASEHLIRAEERAGGRWYELSHDKFVGAIQSGNRLAFETQIEGIDFSAELGERTDTLLRELDQAIDDLRRGDQATREEALDRLFPILLTGVSLPHSRLDDLSLELRRLRDAREVEGDTRRKADNLNLLLTEGDLARENAYWAAMRLASVNVRSLIYPLAFLMLFLGVSVTGIAELSRLILNPSVHQLHTGRALIVVLLFGTLAWTAMYGYETFENFPSSWQRRSERQWVHTLTAPLAPYTDLVFWNEALAGFPLNLLLPWISAAATSAAIAVIWDSGFTAVFLFVYIATSLYLLLLYSDTVA